MKRFVLTRSAESDLDEIKNYLVERAGPGVARRVMKEIRNTLNLLGGQPGIGHTREDLTAKPVRFWPVYSYRIVYDPALRPIRIIRVLHGRRDVEAILN